MGPPSPSRPPRPGRPRRGHAFPARGRWGRATAGGRGRRSARPGWLAGWRGGREGESEWQGASTGGRGQTGSRTPCCPLRFRITQGCRRSAPRRVAELQDLGNQPAHCSFPPLFSLSPLLPFSSLLYLPSLLLPGLPYRGRWLLPP